MKKSREVVFYLLLLLSLLGLCVGFQNSGTTGTFTVSQQVTYTSNVSQIFKNIGQSAHYLSFCPNGGSYSGTVDIEESFDGATNWTPIALADYTAVALTHCTVLSAGGYYQAIRSVVAPVISNSITAYYNATSGPIQFANPGIANQGGASPTICNQSGVFTVGNGSTVTLVTGSASSAIRVCAYQNAGGGTGFINFQSGSGTNCGTGTVSLWDANLNTNQGTGVGQLFGTGAASLSLCAMNSTGASATVSLNYAIVPVGF